MSSPHAVVTLNFNRPVYAHELRPGDAFSFPDAPNTLLTIKSVESDDLTTELTLLAFTLHGKAEPIHLPANTPVRPRHMRRTVSLACLLCRKNLDIEVNLPRDGEPLSLVCADHVPDVEQSPEAE